MRNIVLASIFVLPIFCSAQSWNYTNTNSRYPIIGEFIYSGGIDYQGNTVLPHFRIRNTSGSAIVNQFWAKDSNGDLKWFNASFNAENKLFAFSGQQADASVYIKHDVGIGITNPESKLHVDGDLTFKRGSEIRISSFTGGGNTPSQTHTIIKNGWRHNQDYTSIHAAGITGNTESSIVIKGDGNVGIGVTNPTQKLQVAGTVYSTEVKVEIAAGTGPDYVFEPDYKLRTLEETRKYISKNKHLPEIPSAKEMESNGIEIGKMNMVLLQKIEELTLYMIDMNKRMNELETENQELKKEISTLKSN